MYKPDKELNDMYADELNGRFLDEFIYDELKGTFFDEYTYDEFAAEYYDGSISSEEFEFEYEPTWRHPASKSTNMCISQSAHPLRESMTGHASSPWSLAQYTKSDRPLRNWKAYRKTQYK